MAAAIVGAIAGIAGGIAGAVVAGRQQRRLAAEEAERRIDRARSDRVRDAAIEEVRRTRRALVGQIESLTSLAIGEVYPLVIPVDEVTNIVLLGDTTIIRDYQDLLVYLQPLVGAGLSAEDQAKAAIMQVKVLQTLAAQEDRLRRDEDPIRPSDADIADLLRPEYIATRLLAFDRSASIPGRLARLRLRRRARHPAIEVPTVSPASTPKPNVERS